MNFLFLLGSERSGTNFITKILDNHPNICGPSPTHLIRTFAANLQNYGNLSSDENWSILLKDIINYLNAQLGEWQTQIDYNELKENISVRKFSSVVKYLYTKESQYNRKDNVFIKENRVYDFLPYITTVFPNAKYIYLVRDPRDNILSFKKSPNHLGSILKGTEIWKTDQTEFIKNFFYLKETENIKLVKYEDLIWNTESSLKEICTFLNIDYSIEMLNFHKNELTKKNADKLKNWENLGKPVIKDNFGKYKKELSEIEIKYIEYICQKEMKFFKYDFNFNIEKDIDSIKKQIIEKQENSFQTLEYNIKEKEVREKRLKIISQILSRNLKH